MTERARDPGTKRIPVTLVLHTYADVPEHWSKSDMRFFVEENHCMSNYITEEHRLIEAEPDVCNVCPRATAFLGHVDLRAAEQLPILATVEVQP